MKNLKTLAQREVPHCRVGKRVRVNVSELNAWLEAKGGTHVGFQ